MVHPSDLSTQNEGCEFAPESENTMDILDSEKNNVSCHAPARMWKNSPSAWLANVAKRVTLILGVASRNVNASNKKTTKMWIAIIAAVGFLALVSVGLNFDDRMKQSGFVQDGRSRGSASTLRNSNAATETQRHRSLSVLSNKRWKERSSGRATIPYFISSSFPDADREKILSALDDLEDQTGCLKFVEYTNQRSLIYVGIFTTTGCWSSLGKTRSQPQRINLGPGCLSKGTIQHEFLHALGFAHEQSRPDRDNYVTIYENNIEDAEKYRHNFFKNLESSTLGSPYDYGSVMHYPEWAFAKTGTVTIQPKGMSTPESITIGQQDGVSEIDVKKLKLLYQCERGIVRDWASLDGSPCTTDCKCSLGDTGCQTNDDACRGSLVCIADTCTTPPPPTPVPTSLPTPPPTPAAPIPESPTYSPTFLLSMSETLFETSPTPKPILSTATFIIWRDENIGGEIDYCMDLYQQNTENFNKVWYYQCNYSPAQYWYIDPNNHIRSIIDRNKCLVGVGGNTTLGTQMMIHDCFPNDDRFRWDIYTDGSIRPRNNPDVCIEQTTVLSGDQDEFGMDLVLDMCYEDYKEWYFFRHNATTSERRLLDSTDDTTTEPISRTRSLSTSQSNAPRSSNRSRALEISGGSIIFNQGDDCEDTPLGWYDFLGRNCLWYAEDTSRCEFYGNTYKNFGATAMVACCICGGGSTAPSLDGGGFLLSDAAVSNDAGCWDAPDFYDSTGDGCDWYEEDGNYCEYFGWQFSNEYEQNANAACCVCGGGLPNPPSGSDFLSQQSDAVPECSDSIFDWANENGDDCSWYGLNNHCDLYGEDAGVGGNLAKDVCCVCGGGQRYT